MDQPDRKAQPQFSQPVRQIMLMLIVLGLSGLAVFVAAPRVLPVFEANPWLNGVIGIVFVIGVLACFWQVAQLVTSVRWIEAFTSPAEDRARGRPEGTRRIRPLQAKAPQLLAPLATLLRSRSKKMQIGSSSTRSILDSVATRIDEAREITRYLVNLLIFLGLLGTFYGLATTVPALIDTIRNLSPAPGEPGTVVFGRLMTGLESQLGGMGVAFGSSLLGLSGSLVVGLLELFAGHGQNRFYRELEEWLSTITRLGYSSGEGDGGEMSAGLGGALEHMADQMEALQSLTLKSETRRNQVDDKLGKLADAVERMTERMEAREPSSHALMRVADGQERLLDALQNQERGEGIDAESRMRLRSIDVQMLRILEEISAGRQESMAELRTDISALTRALTQPRQVRSAPVRRAGPLSPPSRGEEG